MQLSQQLLDQVVALAEQAGQHLLRFYQQPVDIQKKADNTPVTEADLFASQFLTQKLTELCPDIPVLSEENCDIPLVERSQWQQYWLIDPLDGTQQFIKRTDQFGVMIALMEQGRPILGVIHLPVSHATFYAAKRAGAFKKIFDHIEPLLARSISTDRPLKITLGAQSSCAKVKAILPDNFSYEFLMCGSSGLKSTLVADGVADCYIRMGKTGEWDTAASEILLAEMGGVVCDLQGQPLSYNQREHFINPPFIMLASADFDWENTFQFN